MTNQLNNLSLANQIETQKVLKKTISAKMVWLVSSQIMLF